MATQHIQHNQSKQTKQHYTAPDQPKAKVEPVKSPVNPDVNEERYMELYNTTNKANTYLDFSIKLAWFMTSENIECYDCFLQNKRKVQKFLRKVDLLDVEFCKKELAITSV
jgi:hypothetical protein